VSSPRIGEDNLSFSALPAFLAAFMVFLQSFTLPRSRNSIKAFLHVQPVLCLIPHYALYAVITSAATSSPRCAGSSA